MYLQMTQSNFPEMHLCKSWLGMPWIGHVYGSHPHSSGFPSNSSPKNIVIFEIIKIAFSPKNLSSCLVFFFWLLDSSFWIIIFRANPLRKSFRMTGRRHRSRISANASASLRRWNIEPSSNFRISRYVLFDESGTLELAFIQQINNTRINKRKVFIF